MGRNIYYGGYCLDTQPGSAVAHGLYFLYQAMLKGSIANDLNAGAGAVELDGSIGGNALISVAPPGQAMTPYYWSPYGLRVGPNAQAIRAPLPGLFIR